MQWAIEKLDADDPRRGQIGVLRYRNDYGSVVYSEVEVSLWTRIVHVSRRLRSVKTNVNNNTVSGLQLDEGPN